MRLQKRKRDKKAAKADKKAQQRDTAEVKAGSLAEKRKTAYILRQLGYSYRAVAQTLQCSVRAVIRWEKEGEDEIGELPLVQAAIDRLTSIIPIAANQLSRHIHSKNPRVSLDACKLILVSSRVLIDRKTHEHEGDFDKSTADLIDEAQRIISQRGEMVAAGVESD